MLLVHSLQDPLGMADPERRPSPGLPAGAAAPEAPEVPVSSPGGADQPPSAHSSRSGSARPGPHSRYPGAPSARRRRAPRRGRPEAPQPAPAEDEEASPTVVDVVPADVTPWIETPEVTLLLESMRVDVTEEEGRGDPTPPTPC